MKAILINLMIFLLCGTAHGESPEIPYSVPEKTWNQDWGNHRAEIMVSEPTEVVHALIPWRRRDANPGQKRLIVTDVHGTEMKNIFRININREFGEFSFQPESGAGTYYVYYMPFQGKKNIGSFDGDYLKPEPAPDGTWVKRNELRAENHGKISKISEARVVQIQSRTAFDSFYPMEVCATAAEVKQLVGGNESDYLLFPEDRLFPIRMTDDLPQRWILKKTGNKFGGKARRNEYYTFQIGVFAARKKLENLRVSYNDFQDKITCFNLEGTDFTGKPFIRQVDVPQGKVQALWFGVDIPEDTPAGTYSVDVSIQPENDRPQTVTVTLQVLDEVVADRGDSQPKLHSRLRWLNSTLGIDDNVVAPYAALRRDDKTISCLLRSVKLNNLGLPESITAQNHLILNQPVQFVVETEDGVEQMKPFSFSFTKENEGVISWTAEASGENVALTIGGSMEFDGHIRYSINAKALKNVQVKDIRMEMPVKKEVAQYFMGMGQKGGYCPESYDWKWKEPQDSYWIGAVDAGLHCEMHGASYRGPLLNLYRPDPPASWYNRDKGGFSIRSTSGEVVATTYSGERQLAVNQEIGFEFALLVTPVKELNPASQFTCRYYHNGNLPAPAPEDLKSGIKITNVHHANPINPYVNYPFIAVDSMKNFVNDWHGKGLKVKIYYTIRELTNQTAEIWALRSLGTEILGDGRGGGYPWLREHFVDRYNVQWFTPITNYEACDAAVITSGQSRWYNYYVEGLRWLVKNVDIDGLYLDDVAFDRDMLKRMRKVMESVKPGCILDLHSNTGFSKGPANQYAEYFPYIDKLWFGESFMYNQMPPDNWLVEVSGIPFGLMGDMLHGGGNPWRGMVYGMTVRYPWYTEGVNCDPRQIWKVWDAFGIAGSQMMGYWNQGCPIKTDNPEVQATAFVKNGKTLIALASWAETSANVR